MSSWMSIKVMNIVRLPNFSPQDYDKVFKAQNWHCYLFKMTPVFITTSLKCQDFYIFLWYFASKGSDKSSMKIWTNNWFYHRSYKPSYVAIWRKIIRDFCFLLGARQAFDLPDVLFFIIFESQFIYLCIISLSKKHFPAPIYFHDKIRSISTIFNIFSTCF